MTYTHHNNALTIADVGKHVSLKGFVAKKRDLGNLVFIDLRDTEGITQLAFYNDNPLKDEALAIRSEFVIEAAGVVTERSSKNPNIKTGDIEINVDMLNILSTAEVPPMLIQDDTDALEDTRLRYRYLDLRRPYLQNIFKTRHKITSSVREFLNGEDFLDIDTPMLTKSTPEGARDYIVPSRNHKGNFYALPQSPQIFKQLLMIGGFEKYYQIAKCFRDEDLRSDRQPEFTQIDIEMSFIDQEAVLDVSERMMVKLLKDIKNLDIKAPFPRMTYAEALRDYGTDKPDTRFGMLLKDLSDLFADTSFKVFENVLSASGIINAINVKDGAGRYSRKDIDKLTKDIGKYGAKGLAFIKMAGDELSGPTVKFFTDAQKTGLIERLGLEDGDLGLLVADKRSVTKSALAYLRNRIAKEQNLYDDETFDFHWVVDWPMFEYNEEDGRYYALHHPFTRIHDKDKEELKARPGEVLAYGYDLVVQGQELGGGSMRIHDRNMQAAVFEVLGMDEKAQREQFGFFLDALKYGTPPHGGIAFGLDRLVMVLAGTKNMRDVIAFPKTASAHCLLTDAPSHVSEEQLYELGLEKIKTDG